MRLRSSPRWTVLLLTCLFGVLGPLSTAEAKTPIAVIVHEQVPVDDISLSELRRIFLGERQFWSRDLTIILLTPPQGSQERQVLLNKIYERRSEAQYKHYWINKLFGGGAQIAPKTTKSPEMTANLVRGMPGAVALIRTGSIPSGVKVLRIDGKQPGEAGYPLVT
jgi:ABC-type phosphate transport system substrate-binding protein